jgi:serpin B
MNLKPIIAIVVSLLILGTVFVFLTTEFNPLNEISETEIPNNTDLISLGNITSFNDAVNQFCFDFFKKLAEDESNSPNIFYSPYSVFTALAMVYDGARNNTAVEMENVLHIEQDNDSFHEYMQSLYNYLNYNDKYNISTANALWPDVGFNLLVDYVNIIETYYGGKSSEVEYAKPEEAARIINEWVENQTNNLIKNLVPASAIDPILTKLILTNAIYFKGVWQVQFAEVNTTLRDFTLSSDEKAQVDTMKLVGTEDKFNYTETDKLQFLELPYDGEDISMMILLPKEGVSLSDVISSLNIQDYLQWIESFNETELDIYLPKFKFETSYTLNDYLYNMGMHDAFTYDADFSGIDGRQDLLISKVLHKAFIEVNEEGTEAAAATAVIMNFKSINGGETSRIVFDVNQPFLFTIHHKETNTILFIGEVTNPLE